MSDPVIQHIGDFTITLRPECRRVVMAGQCRVKSVGFDDVARWVTFYRFLADCSKTGGWYVGHLAAWELAATEVARLNRAARRGGKAA